VATLLHIFKMKCSGISQKERRGFFLMPPPVLSMFMSMVSFSISVCCWCMKLYLDLSNWLMGLEYHICTALVECTRIRQQSPVLYWNTMTRLIWLIYLLFAFSFRTASVHHYPLDLARWISFHFFVPDDEKVLLLLFVSSDKIWWRLKILNLITSYKLYRYSKN